MATRTGRSKSVAGEGEGEGLATHEATPNKDNRNAQNESENCKHKDDYTSELYSRYSGQTSVRSAPTCQRARCCQKDAHYIPFDCLVLLSGQSR
jgi:hypothetical protein